MPTNNNQSKRGKKKVIKKQKKQTKVKEDQEEKDHLQGGFVDLVSLSEPSSPIEEEDIQQQEIKPDEQKGSKSEKVEKKEIIWANLPTNLHKVSSLMIIGQKNTGKSTLCSHLISNNIEDYVLLDCDLGKNYCLEGCVSLSHKEQQKKIWIGELTPLNNLSAYIEAVRYLFSYYREIWFGKKLIVNTMGYTTGLGEFLLYEIFEIIKPQALLAIKLPKKMSTQFDSIRSIVENIENKSYIKKLYLSSQNQAQFATSTKILHYENSNATAKKGNCRYQRHFSTSDKKIIHFTDLLSFIQQSKSPFYPGRMNSQKRQEMTVMEQSKHSIEEDVYRFRVVSEGEDVNMRMVVLGKMIESNKCQLFQASGLGYCFQNMIFSLKPLEGMLALICEGIDFQKGFYHLNERQLIESQLRWGKIPYIQVSSKGLGSKGMRNNPSKVQS